MARKAKKLDMGVGPFTLASELVQLMEHIVL